MGYGRAGRPDRYKPRYGTTWVVYRGWPRSYSNRGIRWFLWNKEHFGTKVEATIVATYLNTWDRQYISKDAKFQVRKFYYSEPSRKEMQNYPINKYKKLHNIKGL
jgi:hypothetical protein